MAMNRIAYLLIPLSILYFLTSCTSKSDNHDSMVRDGLSSEVAVDSLFLGYHFGMTVREFHSSSLEMNQRGEITGYTKVVYRMESLDYPALMEFYPTFIDGVIARIPATISYEGWAPWNEHLQSNKLVGSLKEYYSEVYDAEFNLIRVPEIDQQAYVNIQANREIRIYVKSHSEVMVDFIDLSVNQ